MENGKQEMMEKWIFLFVLNPANECIFDYFFPRSMIEITEQSCVFASQNEYTFAMSCLAKQEHQVYCSDGLYCFRLNADSWEVSNDDCHWEKLSNTNDNNKHIITRILQARKDYLLHET